MKFPTTMLEFMHQFPDNDAWFASGNRQPKQQKQRTQSGVPEFSHPLRTRSANSHQELPSQLMIRGDVKQSPQYLLRVFTPSDPIIRLRQPEQRMNVPGLQLDRDLVMPDGVLQPPEMHQGLCGSVIATRVPWQGLDQLLGFPEFLCRAPERRAKEKVVALHLEAGVVRIHADSGIDGSCRFRGSPGPIKPDGEVGPGNCCDSGEVRVVDRHESG